MSEESSRQDKEAVPIVLAVLRGEVKISEAASRWGIDETVISKWLDQFLAAGTAAIESTEEAAPSDITNPPDVLASSAASEPHRSSELSRRERRSELEVTLDKFTEGLGVTLNAAQREAVETVSGPVAILAGAGTGKTTTVACRIAFQIATGTFRPSEVLAVTFTAKAAGELTERLTRMGIDGVEVRTFHAAALAQLHRLWRQTMGSALPDLLNQKVRIIAPLCAALPVPHKFVPRRDFANEIEWAKNRRISTGDYMDSLQSSGHIPPIPAGLMAEIYEGYERRKRAANAMDFEDILSLAVTMFDEHPAAIDSVRDRFAAFTVDEFQDVNPLQAELLDRWLGDRDDVCVVGDDYQTIYAFTGASPSYLLDFPRRFPHALIVKLEDNYRSTPQVLALANRLAPLLGGHEKHLAATRQPGPEPTIRSFPTQADEVSWTISETRRLNAEGIEWEQMAILIRINARTEPFEAAFAAAQIPYQVRDGSFLRRPGPRSTLAKLRREPELAGALVESVDRVTEALGYAVGAEAASEEEATLQSDLARMRTLAQEFIEAHPDTAGPASEDGATIANFIRDLPARFSAEETGRGVQLLTYHRAKGLEFDAVFLPNLVNGNLPFRKRVRVADLREERRLLYVGITRARQRLALTWSCEGRTKPSPFIAEATGAAEAPRRSSREDSPAAEPREPRDKALFDSLRAWRKDSAAAQSMPAFCVFNDATLWGIASARPSTEGELATVKGIGPAKLEQYGAAVLAIVSGSPDVGESNVAPQVQPSAVDEIPGEDVASKADETQPADIAEGGSLLTANDLGGGEDTEDCRHGMARGSCGMCKGANRFGPSVFVSGGGSVFHKSANCRAMLEGKKRVDQRGGKTAPVEKMGVGVASTHDLQPCAVCYEDV